MSTYRIVGFDTTKEIVGETKIEATVIDRVLVVRVLQDIHPGQLMSLRDQLCSAFPDRQVIVTDRFMEFLTIEEVQE